jgi:hypothetical protein
VNVIPYSFSSPKIRLSITATYRRPRRSGPGRTGVPTVAGAAASTARRTR